jgi:hypothetical protein
MARLLTGQAYVDSDCPLCQLCFKKGHTTDQCYKRFVFSHKPHPPRPPYRPKQHQRHFQY